MSDVFKVFYCDSLLVDDSILEEYATTIQKFIQNPSTHGLDVERLANSDIFSIRVDHKARLLFTITENFGGRHIVILKDMPDHDHHRQDVLHVGGLERFYSKHSNELADAKDAEAGHSPNHFHKLTPDDAHAVLAQLTQASTTTEEPITVKMHKARFVNKQFIEFNEIQEQSQHIALPILVNGIAGSGKTAVSLIKLKQLLKANHTSGITQTYYFITPAPKLKNQLYNTFCEMLLAEGQNITLSTESCSLGFGDSDVKFLTITQFNEQALTADGACRYLSKDDVIAFLETQLLHFKQRDKNPKDVSSLTPDLIYQEIGTLQGLKGNTFDKRCEKYQALGARQTVCSSDVDKQVVIDLAASLGRLLEQDNLTHVGYDLPKSCSNVTAFIDEAQLLSLSEIKLVEKFVEKRLFICMDTNQAIFSNISVRQLFIQRCHDLNIPLNIVTLPYSYRNSIQVTHAADQLLLLKNHICGSGDKLEAKKIESKNLAEGSVEWLDRDWEIDHNAYFSSLKNSHEFAVVLLDEQDRSFAETKYPKDRIFLANEIQGLEYLHIVLFNPFSKNLSHYISKNIANISELRRGHRANEAKKYNGKLNLELKRLIVAVTRAQHALYIDSQHSPASTFWQTLLIPEIKTAAEPIPIDESTPQDWLNEAKKLINENLIEQAKTICTDRLGYSTEAFETLVAKNRQEPKASYSTMQTLLTPPVIEVQAHKNTENKKQKKSSKETEKTGRLTTVAANSPAQKKIATLAKNLHLSRIQQMTLDTAIAYLSNMSPRSQMAAIIITPDEFKHNEAYMFELLKAEPISPMCYMQLPDKLQRSLPICLTVIRRMPALFRHMPESIRANTEIAEECLIRDGRLLAYASDEIKSSAKHIFMAQINHPMAFEHAIIDDPSLLEEHKKASLITDIKSRTTCIGCMVLKYELIEKLASTDKKAQIRNFVTNAQQKLKAEDLLPIRLQLIYLDINLSLELYKKEIFDNKKTALLTIILNPDLFSKLPNKLKRDNLFIDIHRLDDVNDKIISAIEFYGEFIQFAPKWLLSNPVMVGQAMVTWPNAVYSADPSIILDLLEASKIEKINGHPISLKTLLTSFTMFNNHREQDKIRSKAQALASPGDIDEEATNDTGSAPT